MINFFNNILKKFKKFYKNILMNQFNKFVIKIKVYK